MTKFYLDTNIWLDFFLNRSTGLKPIGEYAFQFLKKAVEFNSKIFYSDLVLKELFDVSKKREVDLKASFFEKQLEFTVFCEEDYFLAKQINFSHKTHFADASHIAIASRVNAIIITRDKHFDQIDFVEVKTPEEALF